MKITTNPWFSLLLEQTATIPIALPRAFPRQTLHTFRAPPSSSSFTRGREQIAVHLSSFSSSASERASERSLGAGCERIASRSLTLDTHPSSILTRKPLTGFSRLMIEIPASPQVALVFIHEKAPREKSGRDPWSLSTQFTTNILPSCCLARRARSRYGHTTNATVTTKKRCCIFYDPRQITSSSSSSSCARSKGEDDRYPAAYVMDLDLP